MSSAEKPNVTVPEGAPPTELGIEDLTEGTGAEAMSGQTVDVHYVGVSWSTGKQFDASGGTAARRSPSASARAKSSPAGTKAWRA